MGGEVCLFHFLLFFFFFRIGISGFELNIGKNTLWHHPQPTITFNLQMTINGISCEDEPRVVKIFLPSSIWSVTKAANFTTLSSFDLTSPSHYTEEGEAPSISSMTAPLPNCHPLARFLGEENGKPLQFSCLGNPMDRGAWWAVVHGVTKSPTRLSN